MLCVAIVLGLGGCAGGSEISRISASDSSATPVASPTEEATVTSHDLGTVSTPATTLAPSTTLPATTTVPPILLADAQEAWTPVVADAVYATLDPWQQQDRFFAVAHADDTPQNQENVTGFTVYEFDGSTWEPRYAIPYEDCSFWPDACSLDIVTVGSAAAVLLLSWCCPMGDPRGGGPISTAWSVTSAGLQAATDDQYFFGSSIETDGWSTTFCSKVWFFDTADEQCVIYQTSVYTLRPDGAISTNVQETVVPASFTTCIESVGEECTFLTTVEFDPSCTFDPIYVLGFSLEACEISWWIAYAERELSSQGFDMIFDGYYSPDEVSAVKKFQQANGLEADGYIGPATWRALFPDQQLCSPAPDEWVCGDTNEDGVFGPGDIVPH